MQNVFFQSGFLEAASGNENRGSVNVSEASE